MKTMKIGAVLLCASGLTSPVMAQDNMDKLQNMQRTDATFTQIAQEGATADALRQIIPHINVPEGFEISLYAVVPDARSMAVAPQGTVTFVGTRKDKVWSVVDRDRDRVADDVKDFAPSITFDIPNGPCFSRDGFLYIAERNRVLVFPAAEFFFEGPDPAVGVVVAQGELIPAEEESFNHTARVCRVGPDGKLYISLGQPHNVQPAEKVEMYDEIGIGGIIRINTDGTGREVYTRGIRNSVGHDFNPANGDLWFTDNQVDGMGDDIPPGELNRQTAAGQHFGFPWTNSRVELPDFKNVPRPEGVEFVEPQLELTAHAADLGMSFYRGNSFPDKYKGGIFWAQHGSWNRTTPVGARVMFTALDENGDAAGGEVFADGWLNEETGEYRGRPMDIAFLPDGSMLVSDDFAGAIWRIAYNPKTE
ncbi:MAG: PQQ-dependent sugar dehydrogenase [Hoeflea sp.]|nr:PQQ-dependent sugar dehydrogenase [Alphaproteobacteria bacterium]MBV1726124.1 PQQ-dependent sugar dehydrogenase [Hoeflea sp.]MBU4542393.1 PQQ-dependent sugar dehydrogenase [Alphaproteobacteria bacterium]MBU4550130.1 PQQ-dependent sugar dehydrogenase [Alphaproteobacteria bacterium]MBV1762734.1 PQQ-dependent sugar dehydrogenase [Hoeflea sp.]